MVYQIFFTWHFFNVKILLHTHKKVVGAPIARGFESLPSAYAAPQKWIKDNNYKIAGPNRKLYLEGEWSNNNIDEYITEIQIPVVK